MFQVTAIYQSSEEISYAEGESYEHAAAECVEGIPSIYPEEGVTLRAVAPNGMTINTPLTVWKAFQ